MILRTAMAAIEGLWTERERLAVRGLPEVVALLPGTQDDLPLHIANDTRIIDEVGIQVEGLDPNWYTLERSAARVLPGEAVDVVLRFHLPDVPPPLAGRYAAALRLQARADGASGRRIPFVLDVLPMEGLPGGGLEVVPVPQNVTTGGTAHVRIDLSTIGNFEQLVDVAIADPLHALHAALPVDRYAVAPGQPASATVTLSVRRPPLFAPPTAYPYEVVVSAA